MTLAVISATGMVTVQDLGRPGRMHEGLAPGGTLVPELLIAANRRAHNADGAAALEVLGRLAVRAEAAMVVATDDTTHALGAGDVLTVASEPRRVAYLAVRGGIVAPLVLGGRGTQRSAGLGALVRAGDRITAAGEPPCEQPIVPFEATGPIRVVPGPDGDAFDAGALAALFAGPYTISPSSDRVGTRLDGPPLPRVTSYRERSRPMVRGAIEVPRDGKPIVLGPEHPTTGGYPVVAVIAHADLGKFFAIRAGNRVTFAGR
jgi:allophanate hydrolase subunit 2